MASDNKKRRSSGRLSLPLKILVITAVTALLLVFALCAAVTVVARGNYAGASERLCATMTEHRFLLTGMFFTSSEIREAGFYRPVREAEETVSAGTLPASVSEPYEFSGTGWKGRAFVFGTGSVVPRLTEGRTGGTAPASLGISGGAAAVFRNGCLTYSGDGGDELYCVVACDADGTLHIGGKTVFEIANSGYEWALSADRVLVSGGKPCTGLGGGYAPRAAIGQTADGSTVVFCAEQTRIYPCGITYDELASVMYGLGCVNAAALSPAGALSRGGEEVVKVGGRTEYTVLFTGREGTDE